MKVPYNWLKSYIDFPYSPQELSQKLTMLGLEVEEIEYLGKELDDIVIGEILDIKEHPNADNLVICQANTGSEKVQIVTGAPNVAEGIKVPIAPAGTILPDGNEIKETDLRGKTSSGMFCSKDELGLMEERAAGIMVLEDEAEVGQKFVKYMGLDEYVLNLDLTPNYARCLGMLGIAREVKALTPEEKINYPETDFENSEENISDFVDIQIESPELCPRYTGRLVKNVKIGPSPEWMQNRLKAADIRPINNIVDITNYVLLEYNQPLHAFDYDKIEGNEIIVRRAEPEEKIVTLEEEKLGLDDEVLVISDTEDPIALAGIMGGANSEVTETTTNILIESAFFQPANIRKTSRKFGITSDSSHRFERGVDIEKLKEASARAAYLMQKYAGAEVVEGVIDKYPQPFQKEVIELDVKRVNQILGLEISQNSMKKLLKRLEFKVKTIKNEKLKVTVPSYRNDVEIEADLIEEIARMYGYNNIPVTQPESRQQGKKTESQKIRDVIKDSLIASGLDEINTFSLIDDVLYDKLDIPQDDSLREMVEIKNPLTEAFSVMRTSLIPNMIKILSRNSKRQLEELKFFEIGKVFFDKGNEKRPEEKMKLAGGSMGYANDIWDLNAPDFFYLKGVIENLCERLNLNNIKFKKTNLPFLHPGRTAEIEHRGEIIGVIGEILPQMIEEFDLSSHTAVFQLDVDSIEAKVALDENEYVSLPRYPAVARDLSIVVDKDITADKVINTIENTDEELLKKVNLFDLYEGEQIASGKRSLAFKLLFQAEDRTLTDSEVDEIFKEIIENLQQKYDVSVRK